MTSFHRNDDKRPFTMPKYKGGRRVHEPTVQEKIAAADRRDERYYERERLNEQLADATASLERMDEEDCK